MLWFMNHARQNPAKEGVWLANLEDTDVDEARRYFGVDLDKLKAEFASYEAKPPAAFDARLYEAALAHAEDLVSRDAQDLDGQSEMVKSAGFNYSAFRGSVFSYTINGLYTHAAFNIDWGFSGDGMQNGRPHRVAVMSLDTHYSNVGIAMVKETDPNTSVGPKVVAVNYAAADTAFADHFNKFLVGTVWEDKNGNGLYDPGEGIGGIEVRPHSGTFYAITAISGGYAIPVEADGMYSLSFTGEGVRSCKKSILSSGESVLVDYRVELDECQAEPPVAAFAASPTSGLSPLNGVLDYSGSYDPDGEIVEYAWTVNGSPLSGAVTSGDTKTLTLSSAGTYVFKLTVTDNDGLTDSTERTVTVEAPATAGKTLILTNYQKLVELYGVSRADAVMQKLDTLAAHSAVQGTVVRVEEDTNTALAYSARGGDYANKFKANSVAEAIRQQVLDHWNGHLDAFEYLVLVGDDRVLPMYRLSDFTRTPDPSTLSDNYYADYTATNCAHCAEPSLYVPDIAAGRLIETPEQITGLIDAFLAQPALQLGKGAVSGYAEDLFEQDFIGDSAKAVCKSLQSGVSATDCSYAGVEGDRNSLLQRMLQTEHDIKSINAHANYNTLGFLTASDVANAAIDLGGKLVYTLGCHAGENRAGALDLAEAFAGQQTHYIANTGYGWGADGVVLSEQLQLLLTDQLVAGSATLGKALMRAKQAYFSGMAGENGHWSAPGSWPYHEKVASELTLYGLPMLGIQSALAARPDPVTRTLRGVTALTGGAQRSGLSYDWNTPSATSTAEGRFFTLDGQVIGDLNKPILPQLSSDITDPGQDLHGIVFRGGSYNVIDGAPPLQSYTTTTGHSTEEGSFNAPGWYPSAFFTDRTLNLKDGDRHSIIAAAGQYNPNTRKQRIFARMDFDAYHHAGSQDWTAPAAYLTSQSLTGNTANVSVTTSDASGVAEVVVAHTDGNGSWNSVNLADNGGVWSGGFAATASTEFFIQSVDQAGNVAILDDNGAYYRFSKATSGDCQEVNGQVVIQGPKTYSGVANCHAANSLSTSGRVEAGSASATAQLTYSASGSIRLNPGFRVHRGSRFHARIAALRMKRQAPAGADSNAPPASRIKALDEPPAAPIRLSYAELPAALQRRLDPDLAQDLGFESDAAGEYIVFAYPADLLGLDRNGLPDIYLYTATRDRLELISLGTNGIAANGPSRTPRIDGGGRYIVYASKADDLTADAPNAFSDIHLYDLRHRTTQRLTGAPEQGDAGRPDLATRPAWVVYEQSAQGENRRDIRLQDLDWPQNRALQLTDDQSTDHSHPLISADGRKLGYLAEQTDACAIVVSDLTTGEPRAYPCLKEENLDREGIEPTEIIQAIERRLHGGD